jgi:hypothetical protein
MLENTLKMGKSFKILSSEKMTLEDITAIAFSTKLGAKVDSSQSSNLLDKLSE